MTSAPLAVVGLGPAGLDRLPATVTRLLLDPDRTVVVRTLHHPAAAELAARRTVASCDDLYDTSSEFDDVYRGIARRLLDVAASGPVVYAVPGSAAVGERSVVMAVDEAERLGMTVEVHAGESFLDLVWARTGCDPITHGVQILDGRQLPDPLQLHLPTVVTQVDTDAVMGDVAVQLGATLTPDTPVTVLTALGAEDEEVVTVSLGDLVRRPGGPRTTLFLDPPPNGWHGLVAVNRTLRRECPWDRRQTHHSLVPHLLEEAYETVDTVSRLDAEAPGGDPDPVVYAELEEELGDLLLQVVFHATLAGEAGMFGVEEVAEAIRRKLVHRHPHVFADVVAEDVETVAANWDRIKADEKRRDSLMDDVPAALPAAMRADKLQRRAASVGFDWPDTAPVLAKLAEEIAELEAAVASGERGAVDHELGDVFFSVVNLARHLDVDAESSFRSANTRFSERFRQVERLAAASGADLAEMSLTEMDDLWEQAKSSHDAD